MNKSLVVLLIASTALNAATQEVRTWTSASGKTIDADFLESRFGDVVLQPPEGDKLRIRLNQLSSADQIYVGSQGRPGAELKLKRPRPLN